MMSNICLKSEKSKCSIGCSVGSAERVVDKQVFNKPFLRKELFLMNSVLSHYIIEWQKIMEKENSRNVRAFRDHQLLRIKE